MVGCPIIGINDSGGARIQDAVTSLAWYAELAAATNCSPASCRRSRSSSASAPAVRCTRPSRPTSWWPCATRAHVRHRTRRHQGRHRQEVSLDELGGADHQARYGNIHQVVDSRTPHSSTSATSPSSLPPNTLTTPR